MRRIAGECPTFRVVKRGVFRSLAGARYAEAALGGWVRCHPEPGRAVLARTVVRDLLFRVRLPHALALFGAFQARYFVLQTGQTPRDCELIHKENRPDRDVRGEYTIEILHLLPPTPTPPLS